MPHLKFFKTSFFATLIGLCFAFWLGWHPTHNWEAGIETLFLTAILAVLEISLSFDNAVVNAKVMGDMTPLWRRRFLTWGLIIAVFGVRFILPILIVAVAGHLSPLESIQLSILHPKEYAILMQTAHLSVTGFGSAFLLMVALQYFFNEQKDVHWILWLERPLAKLGRLRALEFAITVVVIYGMSTRLPVSEEKFKFLAAAIFGLVSFLLIDRFNGYFSLRQASAAGLSTFIYLEVLDASFSVDGVVGAFAITSDLIVIVTGLMIGAMFVRSLTVYLVENKSLNRFIYLEHGAFYALTALAILMLVSVLHPVPEYVTGLIGAVFIGLSVLSSLRERPR